jgi:hypothetical protein
MKLTDGPDLENFFLYHNTKSYKKPVFSSIHKKGSYVTDYKLPSSIIEENIYFRIFHLGRNRKKTKTKKVAAAAEETREQRVFWTRRPKSDSNT